MAFICVTQNLGAGPEAWVNSDRITHLTANATGSGSVLFLAGGATLYVKEPPVEVVTRIQNAEDRATGKTVTSAGPQ